MNIISVFDTTISEYNLGNEIIMEAVKKQINEMFPKAFIYRLPYQQINKKVGKCVKQSNFTFFGGTNSLSSYMNKYKQWDLNLYKSHYINNVILMGIGWWQYQDKPNLYTKRILKNSLSSEYYHSVRDSYTERKLQELGFKVINTGCPTLWNITKENMNNLRSNLKKENVILTLTDYNKDPKFDKKLFNICKNNYKKIYVWIQGVGDYDYLKSIDKDNVAIIIGPSLSEYDKVLTNNDVDYIGTRLHAGIRALQKERRAYFIAIDNRTIEMGNDINLTYVKRDEIDNKLEVLINSKYNADFNIPFEKIKQWKNQFK